jgi:hypothetical protein
MRFWRCSASFLCSTKPPRRRNANPDPDFAANKLHVGREPIGKNVVFLDT